MPGQQVLERYERDENNVLCIDVAAEKAMDLYDNFDRNAPYVRRDLQQHLVDYLIDCAEEIAPRDFVIRFSFVQPVDADTFQRIRNSINHFFLYLQGREQQKWRRKLYRSGMFFLIGICILAASVALDRHPTGSPLVANVFAQGVNIAAWVSLWEALATFLVDWFPYRRRIRLYHLLANAPLLVRDISPEFLARANAAPLRTQP